MARVVWRAGTCVRPFGHVERKEEQSILESKAEVVPRVNAELEEVVIGAQRPKIADQDEEVVRCEAPKPIL